MAGFWWLILIALILSCLFWRCFLPGYVHFANDGPLGQQAAAANQLPGTLTGAWIDGNSIGYYGGAYPPSISALVSWILGPVGVAKFLAPIALLILGIGAYAFFTELRLTKLAATLGSLATVLNSGCFSSACWGVATQQIAFGMDFLALALVVSITPDMKLPNRWSRIGLAGLAVGMNVMEAADIGALFSICIAAFVVYHAFTATEGSSAGKLFRESSEWR